MDRPREIETDGNSNPIQISRLALDIGGSLIKLVYFSRDSGDHEDPLNDSVRISNGVNGRLHFAKFETTNINDCLQFISANKLFFGGFQHQENPTNDRRFIKATGGGAYKFSDLFKEKLGISLEKEDEMDCLVTGANFLLKAVNHEAFTYLNGQKEFVQIDHNDLYPYLLVNIGSGVSMIKVDGDGKFERVSGTSVGGGTFWGLGRLLTKCQSFDELLELSQRGNNRVIDMLVGDIYGGMDYSKIGLSSTAIASSFGRAISNSNELHDYKPEDVSRSLLRMISNNIGQISYLNALRFGLKRIFFGGFFTRGHSYTMDTISVAVHFWAFVTVEKFCGGSSYFDNDIQPVQYEICQQARKGNLSKGEAKAMFLRHEGFLGALGAFMSYERHGLGGLMVNQSVQIPVDASSSTDTNYNPLERDLNETESMQCSVYQA